MRENSNKKIIGITISFQEYEGTKNNEIPFAKIIANYYGIKHHIRIVSKKEFIEDIDKIFDAMDQPSIDGINTWYASKAAAELGLKVIISGVGGDELFLGYESFIVLPRIIKFWKIISRIIGIRSILKILLNIKAKKSNNDRWRYAMDWLLDIASAWWLRRSCLTPEELRTQSNINLGNSLDNFSPYKWISNMSGLLSQNNTLALAQIESTTYLRNQLLRDSDWASMYHGVELRTPLVDSKLLFNLRSIIGYFRFYKGKLLLANAPLKNLPKSIVHRKKSGFSTPVKKWIEEIETEKKWQNVIVSRWINSVKN
jgi:asparagine synthase (glutamine-hydrolysing)